MNLFTNIVIASLFITTIATTTKHLDAPIAQASVIATSTIKTTPLFEAIAKCESGNNPLNKNKNSTASGRFQFLWGTWYRYGLEHWGKDFYTKNIWDYNDNTELAWYVYTHYGTGDWNASIDCWYKPENFSGVDT